jgi:hypothetical protein
VRCTVTVTVTVGVDNGSEAQGYVSIQRRKVVGEGGVV